MTFKKKIAIFFIILAIIIIGLVSTLHLKNYNIKNNLVNEESSIMYDKANELVDNSKLPT